MRHDDLGNEINILLYFADVIFECIRHPEGELHVYDRRVEKRISPGVVPFSIARSAEDGYVTYRALAPWRVIPGVDPVGGRIPLLLGVRRWGRQGDYPEASTLIPLLILGG
jgi:hypothetical protein